MLKSAKLNPGMILLLLASGVALWAMIGTLAVEKAACDQEIPVHALVRQTRPAISLRASDDEGPLRFQCQYPTVDTRRVFPYTPIIRFVVPTRTGKDLLTFVSTRRE
jgi:hypothetical protein